MELARVASLDSLTSVKDLVASFLDDPQYMHYPFSCFHEKVLEFLSLCDERLKVNSQPVAHEADREALRLQAETAKKRHTEALEKACSLSDDAEISRKELKAADERLADNDKEKKDLLARLEKVEANGIALASRKNFLMKQATDKDEAFKRVSDEAERLEEAAKSAQRDLAEVDWWEERKSQQLADLQAKSAALIDEIITHLRSPDPESATKAMPRSVDE